MSLLSSTPTCASIREHFSAYLDGALDGITMRQVSRHLDDCTECDREFNGWKQMQNSLANLGAAKAPADMALRLRVVLSHERSHAQRNFITHWHDKWELFRDNSLRPFGVQVAVAASCIVLVTGFFLAGAAAAPTTTVEANDEPLAGFHAPRYLYSSGTSVDAMFSQEAPLVVEAQVDDRGRVYDYRILSGSHDAETLRALQDHMVQSVFSPAEVLGAHVRGRVVLTFSAVQVKG